MFFQIFAHPGGLPDARQTDHRQHRTLLIRSSTKWIQNFLRFRQIVQQRVAVRNVAPNALKITCNLGNNLEQIIIVKNPYLLSKIRFIFDIPHRNMRIPDQYIVSIFV
jgi:hypothetical protein